MICKTCSTNNINDSKFCTNCGEDLSTMEDISQNNCASCGSINEKENKYCTTCGNRLQAKSKIVAQHQKRNIQKPLIKGQDKKKKNKNPKSGKQNFNGAKFFWITTVIVISAILIPTIIKSNLDNNPGDEVIFDAIKSSNPVIEAKVFEIASKFICSCGSCGGQSLEISKCEIAIEGRQFIRTSLEQNQKLDEIVIAVANKYGWMKPEFASKYNIDPSRVWNPNVKLISKEIAPSDPVAIVSNSESKPWNKVCPLEGDPVNLAVSTFKYNGKIYGFCCNDCNTKFLNAPGIYSRQLNEDGTILIRG